MSIKKLDDFEANVISKSLCGLYLKKGEKGIGLISTVIMNYLSVNNGTIFQSLDVLEDYLKGE